MLKAPGLELLTGEPGVGKTAALRGLTRALNPHRFLVLYQAKFDLSTCRLVDFATSRLCDFGRVDIYRSLA